MTLQEHKKIAEWLTSPVVMMINCHIPNTYGKTSWAGKYARKMSDSIKSLKSEMEGMAYKDGFADVATDIYYPQPSESNCPSTTCDDVGELLKVMNFSELEAATEQHEAKMDTIFEHDDKQGYITINAAYPYHIELSRIPDPEGLVHWISHLTKKNWMTSDLVHEFIRRVYTIKGWDIHKRDL